MSKKGEVTEQGERLRCAIVAFIREYNATHPYCPSLREIMRGVGLSSVGHVHQHLRILRARGEVDWLDCGVSWAARTIHIPEGRRNG